MTTPEKDVIQYEVASNGIATIWLNRPHKRNCVSPLLLTGIQDGPHTFRVRAAGPGTRRDPTPEQFTFTVDTTAPETLITFGPPGESWIDALAALVKDGRIRRIELSRIDGAPAAESPFAQGLRGAGFVDGYRGLVLRGS